jgi:uncharacterized protein with GYD domain
MPKFLVQVKLTLDGLKGLKQEGAAARTAAIKKAVESLGGKVEAHYFALGDYDVVLLADFPDHVSAAAFGLSASGSGRAQTKTTALLTAAETDQALQKKVELAAPKK